MKNKNKGFTLIEVLSVIFLISILLSIAVASVIIVINNSKEKRTVLTENNIKKSANLFANEYQDSIVWDLDDENNLSSCISIKSLNEMGYLKKEQIEKYEEKKVKIVKDENNNIIYEKIDDETCQVNDKKLKIPTSENLCNKLSYNGEEQYLINNSQINEEGYDLYINNELKSINDIKAINSGVYDISLKLKDNYIWGDETKETKTISCKIEKATPKLELNPLGREYSMLGTTIIKLKSSIPGIIKLKSSNLNYVTASLADDNKTVENNVLKDININILATRNTNTYVTITLVPSDEYKNNYYTSSIVYNVGKNEKIKLRKPDSTFCKKVYYNNTGQELVEQQEGYKYYDYIQQEIGKYTITAVLKYGYIWEDGNDEVVTFECEIKEDLYTITLDDQEATTKGTEFIFLKYNNGVYLDETLSKKMTTTKNSIIVPTKTGYTFEGYYAEDGTQLITNNGLITKKFTNTLYKTDATIYAKWKAKTYTITYYQGKATSSVGNNQIATSSCTYNEICKLKKYSKTFPASSAGWSFYGWTDEVGGLIKNYENESEFIYKIVGDLKLYAIGKRSIDFYSGIAPTVRLNKEEIIQYWNPYSTKETYLTSITLPTPEEIASWNFSGYVFGSSNADPKKVTYNSNKIGEVVKPAYNLNKTVRSLYERILTIKFNANSGTGTMDNMVKNQYYNSGYASNNQNKEAKIAPTTVTFKLSNNAFKKEGYSFTKWAEGSDTGTQYSSAIDYKKLNPSVDSTKITQEMYAIWKAKTYIITLNNQSATEKGTTAIYGKYDNGLYLDKAYTNKITTDKNKITVPKRTGYTFGGYYTEITGAGEKRINAEGVIENSFTSNTYSENATFYAQWTANKYKIKFDANGGTTPSIDGNTVTEKEVTYDQKYGPLPKTSNSTKKLSGWYSAKSGGNIITSSSTVKITKDTTFYAHWEDEEDDDYSMGQSFNYKGNGTMKVDDGAGRGGFSKYEAVLTVKKSTSGNNFKTTLYLNGKEIISCFGECRVTKTGKMPNGDDTVRNLHSITEGSDSCYVVWRVYFYK